MSQQEASQSAHAAAESARMSYEHAKDAARQVCGQVRTQAQNYYAQGKAKAGEYCESVEGVIRERPLRSVAIAAAAGLVIGLLLRRLH